MTPSLTDLDRTKKDSFEFGSDFMREQLQKQWNEIITL